ncbi:ATP-binding cassette domain-containing protein [Pseudoalteromonas pernae]|uniref:ATP-binding cassette domain-containing protein n=1 Tax=Pseudoalteromonas pernae TaxID=3118054 RepID=UPI003242D941
MSVLSVHELNVCFDNGVRLFSDLSFSLEHPVTALIGRNGVGKSVLVEVLTGRKKATSGNVVNTLHIGYFSQHLNTDWQQSIARFLGVDDTLAALAAIQSGNYEQQHFDVIGEQWQLQEKLENELSRSGLPANVQLPLGHLSGGQLAKLRLHALFCANYELLILDEPSNHLDGEGRAWLLEKIATYAGQILIVSHDQKLLEHVDCILELTSLCINQYSGSYSQFKTYKSMQLKALESQQANLKQAIKQQALKIERNAQKAQKRATQGKKKIGSQAKILLNAQKESAGQNQKSQRILNERKHSQLTQEHNAVREKIEVKKAQQLHFNKVHAISHGTALILDNVRIPFVKRAPLSMLITAKCKARLHGSNGSGKSTLLKLIAGELTAISGSIHCNSDMVYLDQHCSWLNHCDTPLIAKELTFSTLSDSEWRTALAGIGLRGDKALQAITHLSGGERMKLALLVVTQRPNAPLLLLDEPDNHLDLEAQHYISEALFEYGGAFILVSHDEYFCTSCGVEKTIYLTAG